MKKYIFLFIMIISTALLTAPTIFAATSTPSPTDKGELQTIEKIKDMVASKVAQLNLVEKKGVLGQVTDVTTTQVKIKNIHGESQTVDIDELTAFNGDSSSDNFGISDVKKGDMMSFVGLYNKDTEHLLARFVRKAPALPVIFDGVVSEKDTKNYTLTLINDKGEKKIIDIETSTKTALYTKADGMEKSGFSKTDPGVRAVVSGFADKQKADHIIADRILVLQDAPLSSTMKKYVPSTSSSPIPSK